MIVVAVVVVVAAVEVTVAVSVAVAAATAVVVVVVVMVWVAVVVVVALVVKLTGKVCMARTLCMQCGSCIATVNRLHSAKCWNRLRLCSSICRSQVRVYRCCSQKPEVHLLDLLFRCEPACWYLWHCPGLHEGEKAPSTC